MRHVETREEADTRRSVGAVLSEVDGARGAMAARERPARRSARPAGIDHRGSWPGVRRPGARRLGVQAPRPTLLIRPGKPVETAYVESFNGRFRDECLNEHRFVMMAQARRVIDRWRIEYNEERPHSSLRYLTPARYAAEMETKTGEEVL